SLAGGAAGTLVFASGHRLPDGVPAWVGADGKITRLPFTPRPVSNASLSPDGHQPAISVVEGGRYGIPVLDLGRGTDDVLDLPGSSPDMTWNPDGRRLAFTSIRKGDFDIYVKDVQSSAAAVPLLATDRDESPESFSPDGRVLAIEQSDSEGEYRIKLIDIAQPAEARS